MARGKVSYPWGKALASTESLALRAIQSPSDHPRAVEPSEVLSWVFSLLPSCLQLWLHQQVWANIQARYPGHRSCRC